MIVWEALRQIHSTFLNRRAFLLSFADRHMILRRKDGYTKGMVIKDPPGFVLKEVDLTVGFTPSLCEPEYRRIEARINTVALRDAMLTIATKWLPIRLEERERLRARRAEMLRCRTARRASAWLEFVALFVPRRVGQEDIGDAMEIVHAVLAGDRPRWHAWVRVASSTFWIVVAAAREIASAPFGKTTGNPNP